MKTLDSFSPGVVGEEEEEEEEAFPPPGDGVSSDVGVAVGDGVPEGAGTGTVGDEVIPPAGASVEGDGVGVGGKGGKSGRKEPT